MTVSGSANFQTTVCNESTCRLEKISGLTVKTVVGNMILVLDLEYVHYSNALLEYSTRVQYSSTCTEISIVR